MAGIQSAINSIIASGAAVATTLKSGSSKTPKEETTPPDKEKKEYKKPDLEEGYYIKGNIVSQKEINRKYNQNEEFRKRLDKAKERTAANAAAMIQANKTEFERQKLEKKKEKSIALLEQLRKGGDK